MNSKLPTRSGKRPRNGSPNFNSIIGSNVLFVVAHCCDALSMNRVFQIAITAAMLGQLSFAAEASRAARSVHLGFVGAEGDTFYNECVVEKSTDGSYFMVCGWDTGYFGIQQLKSDKKVAIFSVWDPTKGDDPSTVKTEDRVEVLFEGPGTRIKRFGGEGTGGQCMTDFNWKIGETNRFVIHSETTTNAVHKTAYTAFIQPSGSSEWKKLATFRVQTKSAGMRGFYSFVEDFRRDGKSVMDLRRAQFGNGWVRAAGEWKPITKARFTASGAEWESKENIDAGIADGWFYLATGGEIRARRELKSVMTLPEGTRLLPQLPSFGQ
jgi:hypothetical protein